MKNFATQENPAIAVSEDDELTIILDDLISQETPMDEALVGVLSALPSTLSGERLLKVARAVRGALGMGATAARLNLMP